MDAEPPDPHDRDAGTPVGRRIRLGVAALGLGGIIAGRVVQDRLSALGAPRPDREPRSDRSHHAAATGLRVRYYSVTGSVPLRTAITYRLTVGGLAGAPATYTLAEVQAMPQTSLVRDFQCVTGWRAPEVHWSRVRVGELSALSPHRTTRPNDGLVVVEGRPERQIGVPSANRPLERRCSR